MVLVHPELKVFVPGVAIDIKVQPVKHPHPTALVTIQNSTYNGFCGKLLEIPKRFTQVSVWAVDY